jgi:hypothetical protein
MCIMSMSYDNLPGIDNTRFNAKSEPQVKACTEMDVSKRYTTTYGSTPRPIHECSILQEESFIYLLPLQAGYKAVKSAIMI